MKRRLIWVTMVLGVSAIFLFLYLYPQLVRNTKYDLQLGHTPNPEFARINDHSDHFVNNAGLIAMAIYPDKKESLRQAQLYVTKRGDREVLQVQKERETADLAAFEMRLKNLKWEPGEYTLYFKRGLEIQMKLDFTLE
ncbi:hypothetical protein IM700_010595 [Paenibacillus sp. DXFW5]|uniref:DUF5590 domain-containing protein n=1 Tax=Paenibacillus rhizolycopersici TaxID=2780073 RepID=A0ABS2H5K9_9BACL|nr:hypothetical protein [Paenibacillus rhizolycopersici]MBM6996093.1 hypothetical protein [Paenibacillus rhizolycopersici]